MSVVTGIAATVIAVVDLVVVVTHRLVLIVAIRTLTKNALGFQAK